MIADVVRPGRMLLLVALLLIGVMAGCDAAYGCPPQQFVAPQAFYAAPVVQSLALPAYGAQAIVLKQRAPAQAPRVQRQVTRQRIIVR